MFQLSSLSPAAVKDLRRLDAYDWTPARIASILNFRYGLTLTTADVSALLTELYEKEEAAPL